MRGNVNIVKQLTNLISRNLINIFVKIVIRKIKSFLKSIKKIRMSLRDKIKSLRIQIKLRKTNKKKLNKKIKMIRKFQK